MISDFNTGRAYWHHRALNLSNDTLSMTDWAVQRYVTRLNSGPKLLPRKKSKLGHPSPAQPSPPSHDEIRAVRLGHFTSTARYILHHPVPSIMIVIVIAIAMHKKRQATSQRVAGSEKENGAGR